MKAKVTTAYMSLGYSFIPRMNSIFWGLYRYIFKKRNLYYHLDFNLSRLIVVLFSFLFILGITMWLFFSVPDWGESAYLSETWGDKTCVSNSRMFNQYLSLWKNSSKVVLEGEIHSHQTCFFAVWNDLGGFITQSRGAKSIFLGSYNWLWAWCVIALNFGNSYSVSQLKSEPDGSEINKFSFF